MGYQVIKINPKKFHRSQLIFYVFLIPLAVFMILPVIFLISQAFKPLDELFLFPPRILVSKPTLDNFVRLFRITSDTGVPMSRYLFNSIIVTSFSIIVTLILTTATAYALSKKRFKAKNTIFKMNQVALMFVATAVVIPKYFIVVNLGLMDTMWAHIIPYLAIPVGLFLVKQFIDQLPNQLIEAAIVDGANDWVVLTKIVIPLIKPALATVAILTFQMVWNSTEASNLYIITETKKTFAFYLGTLSNQGNIIAGAGISAAAGLIMFIPNLVIFIMMQSKVMDTMSHSGIK